jgi:type IV pilus assembly protein PilB
MKVFSEEKSILSLRLLDRLESKLVEEGLITQEQLQTALAEKKDQKKHLGEMLLELGFVSTNELNPFIAKQLGIPHVDLNDYSIDPKVVALFDETVARKYKMIPLFQIEDVVTVAMADPVDVFAIDQIRSIAGLKIEPVIASEESISKAVDGFFGSKEHLQGLVEEIEVDDKRSALGSIKPEALDLAGEGLGGPAVKIVTALLDQAVKDEASDIHIEPEADKVRVRFRIDGFLYDVSSFPPHYLHPIVSRIKILAKLDIGEKRRPQDGNIHLNISGKRIDLRVSTYPVVHGEKVVIRILDLTKAQVKLEDLGFSADTLEEYKKLLHSSNGIILVTGPTGSGKTTTLYATLNFINTGGKHIITIEDPVEYQLNNISQGQVDPKAGMTFANALRSMLRQDPDIIMVGEIRDRETAELAIHAALTGHLVFSTLHTNDAPGAITRLLDMGVEPFLLSSSLRGVLAQRLVRKVCPKCSETYVPDTSLLKSFNLDQKSGFKLRRGKGCLACRMSGYKGRTGLLELLISNQSISELINVKVPAARLWETALKSGMKSMREQGIEKALEGITTLDEVQRTIQSEKKDHTIGGNKTDA